MEQNLDTRGPAGPLGLKGKNLCNGKLVCNRETRRKPKYRELCKRCKNG